MVGSWGLIIRSGVRRAKSTAVSYFSSPHRRNSSARSRSSALRSVIFRHRVPVDHVPPGLDVIGPAVLVIEIVSVFPNIETEDRRVPVHQRAVLVRSGDHFYLAAFV